MHAGARCAPRSSRKRSKWYIDAFSQDLNHLYPGLAALASFAFATSSPWLPALGRRSTATTTPHARSPRATPSSRSLRARCSSRSSPPRRAAAAADARTSKPSRGMELFEADFASDVAAPKAAAQRYRDALDDQPLSCFPTVHEQLAVFWQLGVRSDFAAASLATVAELIAAQPAVARAGRAAASRPALHRAHDRRARSRPTPRFPPTKARGQGARDAAPRRSPPSRRSTAGKIVGVAGGACGGDMLFHEVCAELGIPTRLHLALPRERFCVTSVQQGGPDWVERYYKLCERLPPRVMMESEGRTAEMAARQAGLRHLAASEHVDALQRARACAARN